MRTSSLRVGCWVAGLALIVAAAFSNGRARTTPIQPDGPGAAAGPASNVVRQGFPASKFDPDDLAKCDTAWEVEWDLTHPTNRPSTPPGSTLRIRSARFMWKDKRGKPHWITVARMVELSEIYVPYDNGWTAFLDIHDMAFSTTRARREFLGPPCVAPGEILKSSNPYWSRTVHKEVHDDGIRWMSAEYDDNFNVADRARRGEKLILWATYYGANYRYLMEYGFTDDGVMSCRIGPSGYNIFMRQPDQKDTHLHVGCWRLEPDLGDPTRTSPAVPDNDILLARRVFDESTEKFAQVARPFNKNGQDQACEGSARWVPEEFTQIRVRSRTRKNSHGRPIAYDLVPQRLGSMRQMQPQGGSSGSNMDFVNADFWVTHTEGGFTSYVDVPTYARQNRPLAGKPTTIWTSAPVLHFPRGEDFGAENGTVNYTGLAVTSWTGFSLKPRDLFDSTPLYAPKAPPWMRFESSND